MIIFILIAAAAVVILYGRAVPRAPDEPEPQKVFDLLSVGEQVDRLASIKDALSECEALQTAAEMSAPDMQIAVNISWTDTEDHEITVYLSGDYSAECLQHLAMREAQEARTELAAAAMETSRMIRTGGAHFGV